MADKIAERKANELEVENFMKEESADNEADFDLDLLDSLDERKNPTDEGGDQNREHQDGDNSDDDAAAKSTDAEIAALGKGDNEVEAGEKLEPKPGEAPPAPAKDAGEPPASTPAAAETKPGEATPAPTDQKPVDQQAPAATPGDQPGGEAQPPSEQDIQQTYKTWRGQSEELLATHYYALDPEVQAELELEPAKVIPRLMAKVYLDAMTASIGQMTMHFPRLVRLVNEQMAKEDESEGEFFKKWPLLKGKENEIRRFGQAWRNLNPAASAEDFVNEVGAGVMVALRLDPTQRGVDTQMPTGRTPAFVPGIGAPPRSPGRSPSGDNPFTQLNQEFEEDIDDDFS